MNKLSMTTGLMGAACSLMVSAAQAGSAGESKYVIVDLFAVQHEERIPERELGFGGRFGVGVPLSTAGFGPTSIEAGLFYNKIKTKDDDIGDQKGLMLDLVQSFDLGGLNPFVLAGIGGVIEDVGPTSGLYWALEAGAGLMFDVTADARLRLSITGQSVYNDDVRPDHDEFVDVRFNVGFTMPFGEAAAPVAAAVAPRAVDSDGDGLADAKDACPSTPASTADGCPPPAPVVQTDSDGDGVYDSQDECAGTLGGLKVDAKGCAVETESQSVVLKGVTFLPGSATLTAEAKTVLDGAASALAGQKNLKVELGGYTDSQGKDSANLALSQKRADSARQYLIGKGIEASRLTAKGYGEASPIADNNTVAGRAENRRVELKVVR